MSGPEVSMLVVGKDIDGNWTVRESAGGVIGRFASSVAAFRFADRERRLHPSTTVASSAGTRPRLSGRLTLGLRSDRGEQSDA